MTSRLEKWVEWGRRRTLSAGAGGRRRQNGTVRHSCLENHHQNCACRSVSVSRRLRGIRNDSNFNDLKPEAEAIEKFLVVD